MTMTVLDVQHISVSFPVFNSKSLMLTSSLLRAATGGKLERDGRHVQVKALSDISFTLENGDRLALVGHNGAGKSTLLRALSGVYPPQSGSIVANGTIGSLLDVGVGVVPEETGRQNIYLRAALMGLSKAETEAVVEDIVEFSDLGQFIEMPVRTYSSGMSVRLAFAMSTFVTQDILIMDEWLSVGDQSFVEKAEARLQEFVDRTQVLVLASHSEKLLRDTCNKALWLEHGETKMFGDLDSVLDVYFSHA